MKNKKQILVLLWIVFLILPAVNAKVSGTGYMHSNDYYSVIYDEEGDAIVAAKLIIQNNKQDSIKEINIEFPNQDIVIYNLVQEVGDKSSPYYDDYGRYNYGNSIFYPVEYDTEQTSTSTLLRLYLPRGIEPQKDGAILILYKIPGDTSIEFPGVQEFDFKTIIDKNAALIQNVRVVINVQEGLYLKSGKATVDYRPDYFNEMQTMSVPKAGMQSTTLSDFSQRVSYTDGLVKNAYNLDPYESFHVKGEFADTGWKLYFFEILGVTAVIIAAIIILKAFLWKKIKVIFMNFGELKHEQQPDERRSYGGAILRSFIFGFASALLIVVTWIVIYSLGNWLSSAFYNFNALIMPLFFLVAIMAISLSIFGFSIYSGIKYGFLEGVLTFVMTILWLFIFLIGIAILSGIFLAGRSSYPAMWD